MRFILTENNNFMVQGQMSGSTPMVNGTAIGVGGPRAPGDMNNNGLSGPALGPVKPPPMSMQAPTSWNEVSPPLKKLRCLSGYWGYWRWPTRWTGGTEREYGRGLKRRDESEREEPEW